MATANYEYIADLELDQNTGLYNLYLTTYNGKSVNLNIFILERRHAMRLYLVSQELYNTTEYVGTLCQLNNILDPFSVRENDVLFYTSEQGSQDLMNVPEVIRQSGIDELRSQVKNELINALKKKKNDPGRRKYLNNRNNQDVLPPSIIPDSAPQSVIENDKILIAPNLFQRPIDEIVSLDGDDSSVSNAVPNNQSDDVIERVLVNRFIKSINN